MSCGYAEGLSSYDNKGKLGGPEIIDHPNDIWMKVKQLSNLMQESKHTVVHTGAGISTAAGIPDFRGPNGVWTLEELGKKPVFDTSWDDAIPTFTHMALVSLEKAGLIQYVISQNIDGLHLKSSFPRSKLAELHGNMFVDWCNLCNRKFVRYTSARTTCKKTENVPCPGKKFKGRKCRGRLYDTILDWEDDLPENDLHLAESHSCAADLSICLGTTLQINPSGKLPLDVKKSNGKLVICNLQATKHDQQADLILHDYVDAIMKQLLINLKIDITTYSSGDDPVCKTRQSLRDNSFAFSKKVNEVKWPDDFVPIDWTVEDGWLKNVTLLEAINMKKKLRKRTRNKKKENENVESNFTQSTESKPSLESKENIANKKPKCDE